MIARIPIGQSNATAIRCFAQFGESTALLDRFAMQMPPADRYELLLIDSKVIAVEIELARYIHSEATSRGISLSAAYYEEMREKELAIVAVQESFSDSGSRSGADNSRCDFRPSLCDIDAVYTEELSAEQAADILRHEQQGTARLKVQPHRLPMR